MTDRLAEMITVPQDVAELIDRHVRSGEFATPGEVVRAGVEALHQNAETLERWLRTEVTAGHAEYLADPSAAISAPDVLDHVRNEYRARRASRA